MRKAGGPGDRWLGHRKMAGREESPDTVLRHALHFVRSGTLDRATRLVTPGGLPRRVCRKAELHASACGVPTKLGCGAAELRKVPQRIDRRRSAARWHRAGKPVRRLRWEPG